MYICHNRPFYNKLGSIFIPMTSATIETLQTMLETELELAEDEERRFRLRTALQLLVAIDEEDHHLRVALENAKFDDTVEENLRELGYL
jgi:hypothetical protein